MIELRTMGAVDLRGPRGNELRAVLQQPKRLALLCYLAIARPRGLHRRDTLLALFWPELDQEHARAALRRALYFLRQAIGPEVIPGRGDDGNGIPGVPAGGRGRRGARGQRGRLAPEGLIGKI